VKGCAGGAFGNQRAPGSVLGVIFKEFRLELVAGADIDRG